MQQLELTFSLNSQGKLQTRKIPQHLETHWTIHRIHSLPIVFYLPQQTSHPHVHWKKAKTRVSSSDDPDAWWGAQLREEFNEDLCKLFVSCGFAWNVVSNPEMHLFCEKWIPGSEVPDCQLLSGQVLNQEVEQVEAKTKNWAEGKIATGMSDRWKNISKKPVNTMLMVVEHKVSQIQFFE